MRKCIIAILSIAFLAAAASAQEAVFSDVSGKVEYQVPGAAWRPARSGDKIGKGVTISTGFKSTANLKIGATTVSLKPITRLTLEELIKTEGGTQTQLFLLSGRVKADVPPQAGQATEFRVKSPTATASVRGTGFEFDGFNLLVDRGTVRLQTPRGQFRSVRIGEFSYIARDGSVVAPAAAVLALGLERIDELVANSDAAALANDAGIPPSAEAPAPPADPRTDLTVTIQ